MRCSVVILNWNGEEMLKQYLPSVVQYSTLPDVEVVVADNGSTDGSMALLSKEFPTVRLIPFTENYGFAGGYNRALEHVESTYTVLLNSDVRVTEGWLCPMLDYMDAHSDVVAVQPKIRSDRKPEYFEHAGAAGGYVSAFGYPYCRGRIGSRVERDHGQYDTTIDVQWCSGAALCIRTQVYRDIGGLDERFFAHMEEIDLCWRLRRQGWRMVCLPETVVYHLGGGSLSYDNPHKTYLNFRNNHLMLYKNLSHGRYMIVAVVRWILDYAAALMFLLTGKTGSAKAVVKARHDYYAMRDKQQ